ncbi:DUF349 domain-containing protein [Maribacter sp. 2307ULW6-5]|uniref:DUF349 domain-containing protein n=1 Tax=Maribacter sp. 2307ULW6-5 TaxID=3386275 RepID=UPI0039BCAA6B
MATEEQREAPKKGADDKALETNEPKETTNTVLEKDALKAEKQAEEESTPNPAEPGPEEKGTAQNKSGEAVDGADQGEKNVSGQEPKGTGAPIKEASLNLPADEPQTEAQQATETVEAMADTEPKAADAQPTPEPAVATDAKEEGTKENGMAAVVATASQKDPLTQKTGEAAPGKESEKEAIQDEIDDTNAEDAEDGHTAKRHHIAMPDYHAMSMENLVGELQRLVKNEKVQSIKKHVDTIREEFNQKFKAFLDEKKEDFVGNGGNEIDFKYNSVTKRQFNEVYAEYREKRNQHYKSQEKSHKDNLQLRLGLIEELKGLVSVEEDMNTTYNAFKDIQEKWRNAGPVPRAEYNNVWRTYHHHVERFYDFLHLNRELRDLDFKHNLEEKQKLVVQAQALANEPDPNKAFRQLQLLHKVWKEDIGPVDKAYREDIWDLFSAATKVIHDRRQEYLKDQDKIHQQNLETKRDIIEKIAELSAAPASSHKGIQGQIKTLESLRNSFFSTGKVPQKENEKTWAAFKEAVRSFNRHKNAFYKNLKQEQQQNLDKKRALLQTAESLKESEDWDTATPEMKRIQAEWKQVGHVPRKYSDKLWKSFKAACNHYFDRFNASKNSAYKVEEDNYRKKEEIMTRLKGFAPSGEREVDLDTIKGFLTEWKSVGNVPYKKKHLNQKFHKIIDALFEKLNVGRQEAELLKYGNKIQRLAQDDDQERAIGHERSFVRKKIAESKEEILQLENNLQFFSGSSEDSPLVQDVVKRLEKNKEALEAWKAKLKKLNIMENSLHRAAEKENSAAQEEEE